VPLLIHQPSYSMLNRWIEKGLLDTLDDVGAGCITFGPLAQGLLTDRYLDGIPAGSRFAQGRGAAADAVNETVLGHLRALNALARDRGQTLAQMALAWTLRDERVTTTLMGASSVAQLEQNVGAVANLEFDDAELALIDEHAVDSGVNLWADQAAVV
jgi:L-glyceraldehyde 3-phosphate reductase